MSGIIRVVGNDLRDEALNRKDWGLPLQPGPGGDCVRNVCVVHDHAVIGGTNVAVKVRYEHIQVIGIERNQRCDGRSRNSLKLRGSLKSVANWKPTVPSGVREGPVCAAWYALRIGSQ